MAGGRGALNEESQQLNQPSRLHNANDAEGENLAGQQEDCEIDPHLVPPRADY
jgi:hypothetical protein